MDKYEYTMKMDELKRLAANGQFRKAGKVLETIELKKIKNSKEMYVIIDILIENERYDQAREFLVSINKKTKSRRIIHQLIDVSIKAGQLEFAKKYMREFHKMAPEDPYNYVFQYQVAQLLGESYEKQIKILENLKKYEYLEKWSYELAKVYHRAGRDADCIAECEDLILWFGEGLFVEKAKLLKQYLMDEIMPSQLVEGQDLQKNCEIRSIFTPIAKRENRVKTQVDEEMQEESEKEHTTKEESEETEKEESEQDESGELEQKDLEETEQYESEQVEQEDLEKTVKENFGKSRKAKNQSILGGVLSRLMVPKDLGVSNRSQSLMDEKEVLQDNLPLEEPKVVLQEIEMVSEKEPMEREKPLYQSAFDFIEDMELREQEEELDRIIEAANRKKEQQTQVVEESWSEEDAGTDVQELQEIWERSVSEERTQEVGEGWIEECSEETDQEVEEFGEKHDENGDEEHTIANEQEVKELVEEMSSLIAGQIEQLFFQGAEITVEEEGFSSDPYESQKDSKDGDEFNPQNKSQTMSEDWTEPQVQCELESTIEFGAQQESIQIRGFVEEDETASQENFVEEDETASQESFVEESETASQESFVEESETASLEILKSKNTHNSEQEHQGDHKKNIHPELETQMEIQTDSEQLHSIMKEVYNTQGLESKEVVPEDVNKLIKKRRQRVTTKKLNELIKERIGQEAEAKDYLGQFAQIHSVGEDILRSLENIWDAHNSNITMFICGQNTFDETYFARRLAKLFYALNLIESKKLIVLDYEKFLALNFEPHMEKIKGGCIIVEEVMEVNECMRSQIQKLHENRCVVMLELNVSPVETIDGQLIENSMSQEEFHIYRKVPLKEEVQLPGTIETIWLETFDVEELMGFVEEFLEEKEYTIEEEAKKYLNNYIEEVVKKSDSYIFCKVLEKISKAYHCANQRNKVELRNIAELGNYEDAAFMSIKYTDFANEN